MLTQIEKQKEKKWNVIDAGGTIIYTARTKKECETFVTTLNASPMEDIICLEFSGFPITNHRICPNRQTVCVPKGCEIVPSTKKSIRTEILAAISEMVDEQELKKNAMLVLTNQFKDVKKSTLQTYFTDCFNEKYTPFKTKYIGVSSEGRLFWIA